MSTITFTLRQQSNARELQLDYRQVFAIGYAGRNMEKTMEHIRELERSLGVPAPARIPTIFQCGNYVLTQEKELVFIGEKTCGEVEYVIALQNGRCYIGVGSDHTDRELEAKNVPKAKQICAKPIAKEVWDYEEIRDHWDQIRLRSWQTAEGREFPYQDGTLADILPVETILKELQDRVDDVDGSIIFSGTVPLLGEFCFGEHFRYEMEDPVLGRKIASGYDVIAISDRAER